jgi:hypothetical protein
MQSAHPKRVQLLKAEIEELESQIEEMEDFTSILLVNFAQQSCLVDYLVNKYSLEEAREVSFSTQQIVDKLIDYGLDKDLIEEMLIQLKLQEQEALLTAEDTDY